MVLPLVVGVVLGLVVVALLGVQMLRLQSVATLLARTAAVAPDRDVHVRADEQGVESTIDPPSGRRAAGDLVTVVASTTVRLAGLELRLHADATALVEPTDPAVTTGPGEDGPP